ncbi:MAG: chemotaxis protein CheD [Desulfobacula sp.]|jgi:chemotaxis protein CheD|nr:chemotaxis protein CheD [Desulfobacula sp.]
MNKDYSEELISTNYFLQPGYIFVPNQNITISSVLGSGVSVCIFDRKKLIGGMNHFQFPYMGTKGKTTALYGNVATITLVRMMLAHESPKKHLEAQIFGGACNPKQNDKDIGRENIEIARKTLLKSRIPILSEDVGGEKGRKVVFNTRTNEVAVLKVDTLRDIDWFPYQ